MPEPIEPPPQGIAVSVAPSQRSVGAAATLAVRAAATRRRDLQALFGFVARRRLAQPRGAASGEPGPPAPAPPLSTARPRSSQPDADGAPRLLERQDLSDGLVRLVLSRPPGFEYGAGQHVKMGLPGLQRNYSLVSAPHQDQLEFFVELVAGGRLSERLRTAPPGTAMAVGRARGGLQVEMSRANQLFVATVTGIAPYVSLIRDHLHRAAAGSRGTGAVIGPALRFVILHGARYGDQFGYAGELGELARQHPAVLTYVPAVSQPESPRNAGWRGERGRVDAVLEPVLARFRLTPEDTAAFACGNPGMVRNVADRFRRRGFVTQTESFH